MKALVKLNRRLAVALTNIVGSMGCAYAFGALAFISLPDALRGGAFTTVSWISQTFLQLVLLSVIMVGNNVLSERNELRARTDHSMIMKEMALLREICDLLKHGHSEDQP